MAYTVMRTAAGSPVAPFVIRALQEIPDVRVVAVDVDPRSCGFAFADAAHVVPRVGAPGFLERMRTICREEAVDLLFPDLDEELVLLAEARADFEAIGTRLLLSDAQALRTCADKQATYQFFRAHGLPAPATFLPGDVGDLDALPWPLIVKPRCSRGSRDVFKVTRRADLDFFLDYVDDPMVQGFVDGVEYTVDTLSDLDGRLCYASVRQRLATDSGISIKGRTVTHPVIEDYVRQIVEGLGLVGPACVQGIETAEGDVRFLEVNPRIAGSAALSMAAGAPLVADAVRLARGEPVEGLRGYRSGLVMLRYWSEHFFDEAE